MAETTTRAKKPKLTADEKRARRRQYYAQNRDRIRAADNASRQRRIKKNPEVYRARSRLANQRRWKREQSTHINSLEGNKDKDAILKAIAKEQRAANRR